MNAQTNRCKGAVLIKARGRKNATKGNVFRVSLFNPAKIEERETSKMKMTFISRRKTNTRDSY